MLFSPLGPLSYLLFTAFQKKPPATTQHFLGTKAFLRNCPDQSAHIVFIAHLYTLGKKHSNGKWTLWRGVSYWKWGYSIAMLVYLRVDFFSPPIHLKLSHDTNAGRTFWKDDPPAEEAEEDAAPDPAHPAMCLEYIAKAVNDVAWFQPKWWRQIFPNHIADRRNPGKSIRDDHFSSENQATCWLWDP